MEGMDRRKRVARSERLGMKAQARRDDRRRARMERREARRIADALLTLQRLRQAEAARQANRGRVDFRLRGGASLELLFAQVPESEADGHDFQPVTTANWIGPDGEVRTV